MPTPREREEKKNALLLTTWHESHAAFGWWVALENLINSSHSPSTVSCQLTNGGLITAKERKNARKHRWVCIAPCCSDCHLSYHDLRRRRRTKKGSHMMPTTKTMMPMMMPMMIEIDCLVSQQDWSSTNQPSMESPAFHFKLIEGSEAGWEYDSRWCPIKSTALFLAPVVVLLLLFCCCLLRWWWWWWW